MLTSDFRAFVEAAAAAVDGTPYADVTWNVGVDLPRVPGRIVNFAPANGAGLDTEWVTDVRGLDIEVVGEQNDFDSGESLAYFVDRVLLGDGTSREIQGSWMVSLSRFGSAPYNTERDDSDRYHFVATYLYEVESGLALNTGG